MAVQAVNQKAGEREEDERRGRQGNREGDAAPTPSNPHICLKAAALPPTTPHPHHPAPAAPQGATLSGTCVELGSFIKACFFSSRWEDLNELSS